MTQGYYVRSPTGEYACLRCPYRGTSFLGIQSHIRKHRGPEPVPDLDTVRQIIEIAEQWTACPHCGKEMGAYAHHCEHCRERVAQPDDAEYFAQYLRERFKC